MGELQNRFAVPTEMKLLHTIRQLQKWGIFHAGVPPSWSEKKKKKAHSFEQNIRTSEHAPAFQMKLRASFNIPPANFLTHVTNRRVLGSGFSFSPLEALSLRKGPRGQQHHAHCLLTG